jgi:hypothetical protein
MYLLFGEEVMSKEEMIEEELKKRTPVDCKQCEFRHFDVHRPYCGFWGDWLTKIIWCNK